MADYQTIASGDTVNAALLTKAVNNFTCAQNVCAGAAAPASPIAYQLWWDTTTAASPILKVRNSTNSAWITLMPNGGATYGGITATTGCSPVYINGIGAGTVNNILFTAPASSFVITDVKIISDTATTASDGSNNYTFQIGNVTAGVNLRSSAKSTNGADIAANTTYSLGLDQNLTIASGDVLRLVTVKTGAPTSLSSARIIAQVNWQIAA